MTATAFSSLKLSPALIRTLDQLGYSSMTLVQAKSLPHVLDGSDVLARAKTGSGKTAAFGLGLLNALDPAQFTTQALVLCPTRELADQVAKEIRRLARGIGNIKTLTLCGGVPLGPQLASLQHRPHVVVGTPGRVLKLLKKESLALPQLRTLVLDEADRMLDMGFAEELDAVLAFVPAKRQTLLFSATFPDSIVRVSARIQNDPIQLDVTDNEAPATIDQRWISVTREYRKAQLVRALRAWGGALNLVFCNTKKDCQEVSDYLRTREIVSVALHGDLDQSERTEVLVRFANRSAAVLVATDVAARGLDVKDLDAVFNYELPREADVYVHRIGRTARAGATGLAISLVEAREQWRLEAIDQPVHEAQIPDVNTGVSKPQVTTIQVNGGRKNKLRPGDLLGALTAKGGVPGDSVGAINLFDTFSFVAIKNAHVQAALRQLGSRPIKGRQYRVRRRA